MTVNLPFPCLSSNGSFHPRYRFLHRIFNSAVPMDAVELRFLEHAITYYVDECADCNMNYDTNIRSYAFIHTYSFMIHSYNNLVRVAATTTNPTSFYTNIPRRLAPLRNFVGSPTDEFTIPDDCMPIVFEFKFEILMWIFTPGRCRGRGRRGCNSGSEAAAFPPALPHVIRAAQTTRFGTGSSDSRQSTANCSIFLSYPNAIP